MWRDEVTPEAIAQLYRASDSPDAGVVRPGRGQRGRGARRQRAQRGRPQQRPLDCGGLRRRDARRRSSSADVVELNPAVDRDGQTARLAALTVWWLLRGRSERR